jgi:peptidoglycan/xylan/chitin deacetylase (PgdA/CDA1 family)
MKAALKNILQILIKIFPLALLRRLAPREAIGIFYHAVSDAPMEHVAPLYPPVTAVQFKAQMQSIQQDYQFITYDELHAYVFENKSLPPRAIHLSFDDGYLECFTVVRPILLQLGIPATFFITTDWMRGDKIFYRNLAALCIPAFRESDPAEQQKIAAKLGFPAATDSSIEASFTTWILSLKEEHTPEIRETARMLEIKENDILANTPLYLSRDQIGEMAAEGFTIGSHTCSHPKLMHVDPARLEHEIVESSQIVQSITAEAIIPFAFPNSAYGVDRNLLADIRLRHPFLGLFFDTKDLNRDREFMFNRIWVEREDGLPDLASRIREAYRAAALEDILSLGRGLRT